MSDRPKPRRLRTLAAASVGNAMEWYDWSAYVTFSALLAPHFFPEQSAVAGTLQVLTVFAIGFLFRPLGGLLFGALSDRHGRARALRLALFLMAGGSLLIAVSPSYTQAGLLAPALLVLARSAQGLSAGGEASAMSTYVNEIAPRRRRGLYSSVIYISTTAGTLSATLLALLLRGILPPAALAEWGWRIPFALGALLAVQGWYMRRGLQETKVFEAAKERVSNPAWQALRHHRRATLQVVGFTVGTTAVYYTFAWYLPFHAQVVYHVPATRALWASVAAQAVFMAALPFAGALADRYGRRPLLLAFGIGFTLLTPVFFTLLTESGLRLFLVMSAALLLFACCAAAAPSAMLEMFPTAIRSSGIGLAYSLTVAVFGGTTPYLIEYLTAHGLGSWYPWYVVLLCLVSTVTFFRYRETNGLDLTRVGSPATSGRAADGAVVGT